MTYSTLLSDESVQSQYLCVLSPKRKVETWTLVSGSVYSAPFDYGLVSNVTINGVSLSPGSSSTLSAGEWYWDRAANILYVRMSDSSDPAGDFVVVTYELYFVTHGAGQYWNRLATDDTSEIVYFEPLIQKSPDIKQTTGEVLYGYQPQQNSSLRLVNAEHIFEKHIYDSTFYNCSVRLYHCLLTKDYSSIVIRYVLEHENIRLILDGYSTEYSYADGTISIKVTDRLNLFTAEYRNPTGVISFYNTTNFPSLDPNFIGQPVRVVYGVVNGFVPVNVDYVSESPTTSDNRTWVVMGEQNSLNQKTTTVPASPASTTTRTYLNSAQGFVVGDSVWFDRAVGTDEYKLVTVVGANYIEHDALVSPMATGDSIKRAFVPNITIIQNNVKYQAMYGRDYTAEVALSGGCSGFSFTTTLEANLSMPTTLSPNDKVFCTVYGRRVDTTIGGSPFGTQDTTYDNMTSPIVILYDLLRRSGLTEAQLDTAAFISLESTNVEKIGLAVGKKSTDEFPTYKEILISLMQSTLIRLFVNNDNKWTISKLAPIVSTSKLVGDDEIKKDSFDWDFSFADVVSDIVVEYDAREISDDLAQTSGSKSKYTATSNTARYLHGISKSKTYPTLHFKLSDVQTLASRLSFILGDRAGLLTIESHKRFFDVLLNDKITVERKKLPGFEFDADTLRTKDFAITEFKKDLNKVTITLDDQKGIQDNQGSW